MTHDQLMDFIDKFDCAGMVNEPAVTALRSVMELHKPKTPTLPTIIEWDTKTFTNHFIHEDKCAIDGQSYPCPTIQAIEKVLVTNVDN